MFKRSLSSLVVSQRAMFVAMFSLLALSPVLAHGPDGWNDDRWHHDGGGAILALSNAASGNAVVMYRRGSDGALTPAGAFATGGLGTGAALMSQGAVVVTDDRRFVLAVNAGSHSISVFRIRQRGLELLDTAPSRGVMPTSIAERHGLVVVLNAGTPNSITGFRLTPRGRLRAIDGFDRPLSGPQTSPAQVAFSHEGDALIVTERNTNQLAVFTLDDGVDGPFLTPSAGPTPYGFAVGARNTLLVSEAGAGGGASTYRLKGESLVPISAAIMAGQRAACWAVLTPSGRFGYVSNAGTGTITGFGMQRDGSAGLLNADGVTAAPGGNPTDMAMSDDGRYLYARVGNLAAIAVFRVGVNGGLKALPPLTGTPAGLAGLAGF